MFLGVVGGCLALSCIFTFVVLGKGTTAPTVISWAWLKRFTMIVNSRRIVHVIYPVAPPNADSPAAVAWLRGRPMAKDEP